MGVGLKHLLAILIASFDIASINFGLSLIDVLKIIEQQCFFDLI